MPRNCIERQVEEARRVNNDRFRGEACNPHKAAWTLGMKRNNLLPLEVPAGLITAMITL